MNNNNNPLVSVAVVTYNSSATIIETLDSIAAQTYQNIELIVSDDCSPDNTVELVRAWMNEHKERFVRCEVVTVEKNSGVAANYNRALDACRGVYVKEVDGDDVLLPTCVEECVSFISEHPEYDCLFSRVGCFGDVAEEHRLWVDKQFDYSFFSMSPDEQLNRLIFVGNCINSSTTFYHRQRVIQSGVRNDERIPLLEDWPKWINLLRAGIRFGFIDKELVRYRITPGALSTGGQQSEGFQKAHAQFYLLYCFHEHWKSGEDRMGTLQQYIRCKKKLTGNWYWCVANRLFKYLH